MAKEPASPLATYTERLPQVKRVLRLHKDHMEIDAAWTIGKNYHMDVQFQDLSPEVSRFYVRNRWFKPSILIGSLAVATAAVFGHGDYPQALKYVTSFGWPVAIVCVIVAFMSYRRRQFARFSRKDGKPGLDICDAGPDRRKFDEFVRETQRRIRNA
jgi:hypothetical protein